jgi:hypothetical protein
VLTVSGAFAAHSVAGWTRRETANEIKLKNTAITSTAPMVSGM